jgi:hypothetical protein
MLDAELVEAAERHFARTVYGSLPVFVDVTLRNASVWFENEEAGVRWTPIAKSVSLSKSAGGKLKRAA